MKLAQVNYLKQNGYKIINNKIVDASSDNPAIMVMYDNEIKKFYLALIDLKVYEYDFDNFSDQFEKMKEFIITLNQM